MTYEGISDSGWVMLDQLRRGETWDGDLVSKCGRTELVSLGLAERGTLNGVEGMNWLTPNGLNLAAKMSGDNWQGLNRPS